MNNKDQKLQQLETLIRGSASFGPEEKTELIQKVTELKDDEIEQAIIVFEQEKAQWLRLKKTSDDLVKSSQESSRASLKNIKLIARKLIQQKESQNKASDNQNAEELLTEI